MASWNGKKLKQVIDPVRAKVFTHPLRGHIWVTLFERGLVSPTAISNELEIDVSDVSYHFRDLKSLDLIRLNHTVKRRGFDEHFYEPIAPALDFDDAEWMQLPAGIRAGFSGETVRQVIEQLTGALEAGSFDARNRHLSQNWLLLDERGWKEAMRSVRRLLDRFQTIQQRSAERRKDSGEPGIPVAVTMAAFETAAGLAGNQAGETDSL
jgi:hypothetical protein